MMDLHPGAAYGAGANIYVGYGKHIILFEIKRPLAPVSLASLRLDTTNSAGKMKSVRISCTDVYMRPVLAVRIA
jgi:hypothetical protein